MAQITDDARPRFLLGPFLLFRGEQGDRWRVSALFVIDGEDEPDDLRVDGVGLPVPPRHVAAWRGRHLWRFDFAVPRAAADGEAAYGFQDSGMRWRIAVPARGGSPRIACAGNSGWETLTREQAGTPAHLLLHAATPLADPAIWRECPALAAWSRHRRRLSRPFTAAMAEEVMGDGIDRCLALWSRPEVARLVASVPSVVPWTGAPRPGGPSGQAAEPAEHAAVPRGVGLALRRVHTLFHLAATPESLPDCVWGAEQGNLTRGFRAGSLGLIALDLDGCGTGDGALPETVLTALPEWLERFQGCRHLLVLADRPLLWTGAGWAGRLPGGVGAAIRRSLGPRPPAQDTGRQRLLEQIAAFSLRSACRVNVLVPAPGLGGRSVLHGGGVEMWQLLVPDATRPPPGRLALAVMEWLAARSGAPQPGRSLETPRFAIAGRRFVRVRGWLSLTLDQRNQLHARWHAEDTDARYEQAI